jgi:hypothetical protein
MKKKRAVILISIILIITSGTLATVSNNIRTVDFFKVLALGIGIGALISQIFANTVRNEK